MFAYGRERGIGSAVDHARASLGSPGHGSPGHGSRYETLVKIASGGMATVYVGRLRHSDSHRLVAIKRPHPHLIEDDAFRKMLLGEANLASRIQHANVVSVRDVEMADESIHLVMDYVEGVSLAELLALGAKSIPRRELARAGLRVIIDACAGLHAAHELTGDDDRPLGLVHRDVSPHNILVGVDGIGRVVDFGIAKCVYQCDAVATSSGTLKGKVAYMAPEHIRGGGIDRRSDIFPMGVIVWELLAGERLFKGRGELDTSSRVLSYVPPPISAVAPFAGAHLDAIVGKALAKEPASRHGTILELGEALESTAHDTDLVARHREVADLLQRIAGDRLAARRARVRAILDQTSAVASGVQPIATSACADDTPAPNDPQTAILVRGPFPAPYSDVVLQRRALLAKLAVTLVVMFGLAAVLYRLARLLQRA